MNISYQWLKDLVETQLTEREVAARLTSVGLAVDTVTRVDGHEAENDYVLEIDVTSNRPDCLSHLGVARELAAIEARSLKLREPRVVKAVKDDRRVEVQAKDVCPRYAARTVRGVTVRQSPSWLVKRLEAIGQRGINNVADITNYVLHELGQPLHAFDQRRLKDEKIIVRRAFENEKITTLDDVERSLDSAMLVIADAEKPVAIAGVMGGLLSGVTTETTDVLIESAFFEAAQVRRTTEKLNLHTEAANRFERGVDPEATLRALHRCCELIADIAGGTAEDACVDINNLNVAKPQVRLRFKRVGVLTGLDVEAAKSDEILQALGFVSVTKDEREAIYLAPSWRTDIDCEEDLIEEVIRHTGLDKVPSRLPSNTGTGGAYLNGEERVRAARHALTLNGYTEAISFSFVDDTETQRYQPVPTLLAASSGDAETFDVERIVRLVNPIAENETAMRTTLLAGLTKAVKHNLNHGTRHVRLFEIGRVFAANQDAPPDTANDVNKNSSHTDGQPRPVEREALALIATGANIEVHRYGTPRGINFYDVKGALEILAESLNIHALRFAPADFKHLQKGQSASIAIGEQVIGSLGRLASILEKSLKIKQPVYVAELDFQTVMRAEQVNARYFPLAKYPSVTRDVSFIINRRTTFDDLRRALLALKLPNNTDIVFVDTYEGKEMPDGFRSMTLRAVYTNPDRTLRDEEVDDAQKVLTATLVNNFGAEKRE